MSANRLTAPWKLFLEMETNVEGSFLQKEQWAGLREVGVLVNGSKQPGEYTVTWNMSGFSGGIYCCRLETNGHVTTKKAVLIN